MSALRVAARGRSGRHRRSGPGRGDITTTRVERNTASEIECVTKMTVEPVSAQSRSSSRLSRSRVISSSAPNGSSISRSAGENDNARAIATRCCMPTRELPWVVLVEPGQLDQLEHLGDPGVAPRAVPLEQLERQRDVLRNGAPVVEDGGLEDDPVVTIEPSARGRLAVDEDRARGRRREIPDHPKQRRLAAARGPDQRDELAPPDLEIDPLERRDPALRERLASRRRARRPSRPRSYEPLRRTVDEELLGADDDEEEPDPEHAAIRFVAQRFCGLRT